MTREAAFALLFERAYGKPVYGYCSTVGRVVRVGRDGRPLRGAGRQWAADQVGGDIDRASVEGDSEWTKLPPPAGKGDE